MPSNMVLFDENWKKEVKSRAIKNSWTKDVLDELSTTGGTYLSTIQDWLNQYPLTPKNKKWLAKHLQSPKTSDHLGGVNELAFWMLLKKEQYAVTPLAVNKSPTPDFKVNGSTGFFAEVSTLNVSDKDAAKFEAGDGIELNHAESVYRFLGKLTDEKKKQLSYANDLQKPAVLVLFDYTEFSGYGTQFYSHFAEVLLGEERGFYNLPKELSALIYLERKVIDGQIVINRDRSAVYHNPHAQYLLPIDTFPFINRFFGSMEFHKPNKEEEWIYLSP